MKNNKGFVVSAVLYPLLILFLALMMGLIAMSSTRKNILDNMKMEISDSIFDSVTCDCEVINNTLKKYSQKFNTVDEEIEFLKTEITNLKTESSKYVTTTTTELLDSKINFLTTKLSDLESRVTKLEAFKDTFKKSLKVGDYVYMKPKKTSYTISDEDTGCDRTTSCSDQTINPSELTLWRVIRINDDKTIDMVSVYASSTDVYFYGALGYNYLVSTLNDIASQYTDNKYVISTRAMGFNGQTPVIPNPNLTSSYSGNSSTSDSTTAEKEKAGAGDTWYKTDNELVNNVFETLDANRVGTTTPVGYWLASRYYKYLSVGQRHYIWSGRANGSCTTGGFTYSSTGLYEEVYNGTTSTTTYNSYFTACAIRPIVTIKATTSEAGMGTSEDPYLLEV